MSRKSQVILPIATALTALAGVPATVDGAVAKAADVSGAIIPQNKVIGPSGQPNVLFKAGEDMLGLIVTQQEDGTIIAQHSSHASHASHASHYSSR